MASRKQHQDDQRNPWLTISADSMENEIGVEHIRPSTDIEDAEFVTLTPKTTQAAVDVKRTKKAAGTPKKGTPLPVFALAATVASCVSFYVAGGHALFHAQTTQVAVNEPIAKPSETFVLSNVTTRIDTGRGTPVFVIRGDVAAVTKGGTVPNLLVRFNDADTGRSMSHIIPRGELLQKGQKISFTTRIPAGAFTGADPIVTLQTR